MLRTEGRVTAIDGFLATAVLLGLVLNAAAGWWWADPSAGRYAYGIRDGGVPALLLLDQGTSAVAVLALPAVGRGTSPWPTPHGLAGTAYRRRNLASRPPAERAPVLSQVHRWERGTPAST